MNPEMMPQPEDDEENSMSFEEQQNIEKHNVINPRAYEVAGGGDYEKIVDTLNEEELLGDEIKRVRDRYETALENEAWMTEKDWEMLAVMDCYDERTTSHCVETLRIAQDRIERFKAGDKKFSELIVDEDVPMEEFYRACLFHDIGKCLIPRSVLNNTFFDEDFDTQFCEDVFHGGKTELLSEIEEITGKKFEGGQNDDQKLREYLRENHIHTMRYVPAVEVLDEDTMNIVRERFPDIDINKATLADLIAPHEQGSEEILRSQGFEVASNIAGRHHNYRRWSSPGQADQAAGLKTSRFAR